MNKEREIPRSKNRVGREVAQYALAAGLVWSGLIGLSLWWNLDNQDQVAHTLALNTARASFNRDQAYRYWASSHGGVYVEPSEKTPPSPWMSHVPERDVTTTTGRALTLMNPAYMLREMMTDFGEQYGVKGRIAGITYLNPDNKADPWEAGAIRKFQKGEASEIAEVSTVDGQPHLRLIKPMVMEQSCQKCHGHLGYENGEVRGAVGVSVPLAPYREVQASTSRNLKISHGVIWLLGIGAIGMIGGRTTKRLRERAVITEALQRAHDEMELRVEERTRELRQENQERRQAESQLRKLSQALKHSPNMVFITDPEGVIEYVNPKFCELTGYSPEEAIGRTPRILKSGDTPDEIYKDLWDTILSGKEWRGELKDRRKDGQVFWANVSISPVRSDRGEITDFVSMHEDITERKLAERDIRIAKEEAEIANRAKSELLANMSHELRTPLNAIIGFSNTIKDQVFGPLENSKYVEYAGDILYSGEHLLQLINDILDVSAIEAGKVELEDDVFPVPETVEACLRLVRHRAEKGGVSLASDIQADLPSLLADQRRIKQILLNLLSNAVKFTPEGGTVTVEVTTATGESLSISVRDTGVGMTRGELRKAMTPFEQVDSGLNRKHEGTGLGLPLAKGLVDLHGARFEIESEKGKGTVARIVFPPERMVRPAETARLEA